MKIGIFADKGISKWLVQSFEPFRDRADITLFVPDNNKHDTSGFDFKKQMLSHNHETWLSLKHCHVFVKRWLFENERKTHVDFYPFSLAEHFSSNSYDVVLTKAERSLYTLASLKDRFSYKLVFRYPYTLPFSHIFNERSEFTRKRSYGKIDHFICISDTARKNLEYEGIDPARTDVVLNSVDLSFFAPAPKDPVLMSGLDISADDRVIMFVGKLTSWKNPFTILYAARPLIQKGLPLKIILIGQGAQRDNLDRTARILNIRERVRFIDFVENTSMNKYYNLADLFVMPSLTTLTVNEQFPFAVVEAMASGLPVIVSNAGGMPELIGDAGRIYSQGNYVELSAHMETVLTDNGLRAKLASGSRERAERMFDNRKNSLQVFEIFKRLVKK